MSGKENSGKKWAGCPFISIGVFFALLLFYILYTLNVNKSANIWVGVILYLSSLFISLVVWYYGTTLACSMNILRDLSKIKPQCITLVTLELIALVLLFPKYFILFTVIFVICFMCVFNYRGEKIVKVITDKICFITKHILEIISESLINLLLVGAILVLYALATYELISEIYMMLSKVSDFILLILAILVILAIVFLASTKFFYTEYECWRKRVRANIEEWFLNDNFFWKALLWSATFLLLFTFVLVTVIILYYKHNSGYEFLVNLITNKDLFEWTFNLFLFTFFALIISVIGQFLSKDKSKVTENKNISKEVHKDKVDENPKTDGGKDSEFLFYMLSVKVLIIWALVLIVSYALTRTFILNVIQYSSNTCICKSGLALCYIDKCASCVNSIKTVKNNNMLIISIFWISIYYAIFITIYYYFIKKFLEVINFAMPVHRLQMKIEVLSRSPLNKNTLRLWNTIWRNEEFGNALKEGVFLSDFVPEIVYHKKYFQLKDQVSVAADALRGFSENIDKRYSEALAREVLNIVPRNRRIPPKRLPEYLVDALNAYKDIVCGDKLVCEEPDFGISFYKGFFRSKANEFLPKYQYLDELIYQILVTLRKSIEKLRNDKYFEKHDESRKILCDKFNDFIKKIMNLKCDKLESALKTESAKKWIKEAGNLLEEVADNNADNNKDINVNNNRSTLTPNFTKSVQALKEGNIDTDALEKVLEKWTEICK